MGGGAAAALDEAAAGGPAVLLRVRRARAVRVHGRQPGDGATWPLPQRHPPARRLEVRLCVSLTILPLSLSLTASTAGNPETEPRGRYLNGIRPRVDWKCVFHSVSHTVSLSLCLPHHRRWKQWDSCALVGRSPVIKIEENGPFIDKHDAVWRFNLAATLGFSNFVGKKTQLRLVNNGDSSRAMNGLAGKSEHSIFTVRVPSLTNVRIVPV
jgi:hypothetical protein